MSFAQGALLQDALEPWSIDSRVDGLSYDTVDQHLGRSLQSWRDLHLEFAATVTLKLVRKVNKARQGLRCPFSQASCAATWYGLEPRSIAFCVIFLGGKSSSHAVFHGCCYTLLERIRFP